MKVLRKGGKFSQSRINFYASKTLFIYATALLVFILFGVFGFPLVGLAIGLFLLLSNRGPSRRWSRWWKGTVGELEVIKALNSLPDDYILINDFKLPDGQGNIDHFLVGPNGLFVLETKNYSGRIECQHDDWFVNGRQIKSLSKQAKANAVTVRKSLIALLPHLESLKNPFIVAVLVFVNPKPSLKLRSPTVPVSRLGNLSNFIRNYQSRGLITYKDRRDIVYHLLSEHAAAFDEGGT